MVFQFEHVTQQWDAVWGKWRPKPFDLVAFKRVVDRWQLGLADDGWNSLFWGNHDLPRAVSRYGHDAEHHADSAKMLATVLHFLRGTPFVYQGEESGMTNVPFTEIGQYRDIETLNMYQEHVAAGLTAEDFIAGANANGRDNARTPMHWSAEAHGGFTTGTPWIEANPNHDRINVAAQQSDERSILAHYRRLIALRKTLPVMQLGRYEPFLSDHTGIMAYGRRLDSQQIVVLANFTDQEQQAMLPPEAQGTGTVLISQAPRSATLGETVQLAPFEAVAVLFEH